LRSIGDVLAAWLGDDATAIEFAAGENSATPRFAAEREIATASRAGDLPTLAQAAHKLKGAPRPSARPGSGRRRQRSNRPARPATASAAARAWVASPPALRRALAEIDAPASATKH
jgi:hypothetical protein